MQRNNIPAESAIKVYRVWSVQKTVVRQGPDQNKLLGENEIHTLFSSIHSHTRGWKDSCGMGDKMVG